MINTIDMSISPLISVVLCTYNDETFISQTIKSVLDQTYGNFEFIIWNDGSTDNTENVIKSFNDDRIRYYYHENTGLGKALKLACKEAKGKYIARIDGDDICHHERFAKQIQFLENNPDYVLVSSSVIYIDIDGIVLGRSFPVTWHSNIKSKLKNSNPITHPSAMFRKDAYMASGGFLGFKSAQDRMLWCQLIKYGKFKNLEEPLLFYRWLNSSITSGWHNNPYEPIINAFRTKICNDTIISEEDVDLYNIINDRCRNRRKEVNMPFEKSKEEKACNVLKRIVGERLSAKVVFVVKNCLYRLIKT